jgi:hypothetical protein
MRNLYHGGRAVVLGSVLVLGLVVGIHAPAWAVDTVVDVAACGDYSVSNPADTKFVLSKNLAYGGTKECLIFPSNAVVLMNGFAVVGPGINTGAASEEGPNSLPNRASRALSCGKNAAL